LSVEAITWALNLAPVPVDAGGVPSSTCAIVLIGLANHAGPDGRAAFPSVQTLVRYTRLSERTVRYCLDRLEKDGVMRPCDEAVIAAHIKRGDRRPKGWDLAMERIRTDLTAEQMAAIARSNPMLAGLIHRVQPLHLVQSSEVQPLHPEGGNGVQLTQARGAVAAPEPSLDTTKALKIPPADADGAGKPPKAPPADDTPLQIACRATWHAYANAYKARYTEMPVRNAPVNTQIKAFVQRIGHEESPQVAAFYVRSEEARYKKSMHDTGNLLRDAEKLRTAWKLNLIQGVPDARAQTNRPSLAEQAEQSEQHFAGSWP
jgi:hypothetical protein